MQYDLISIGAHPDDVEVGHGGPGFHGQAGDLLFPHQGFHIRGRGKEPFRCYIRSFIKDGVKNLETEMGSTYFIKVRKGQGRPCKIRKGQEIYGMAMKGQ